MSPSVGNVSRPVLLIAAVSFLCISCAVGPPGSPGVVAEAAGVDAATCAGTGVLGAAIDLVGPVLDIVRGGGADWSSYLDKLKARGVDALNCALTRALAHLTTHAGVQPSGAPQAEALQTDALAAQRIREYLKTLPVRRSQAGPDGGGGSPARSPSASPATSGTAPARADGGAR